MSHPPQNDTRSMDEETPLLSRTLPLDDAELRKFNVTPIPKVQLAVLAALRTSEPILFCQIFPYINEFLSDLHLTDDPKEIGLYSGAVESLFAFAQLLPIYGLARLSDHVGRRPVVICGIAGAGLSTILFGTSSTFTAVLAFRALAGLCAGNPPVMHAMVGELSDESNQATILPLYGLTWPVGVIIGPMIGGTLEHAATKYPKVFKYTFLEENPYFLPCLVSGLFACITAIVGVFLLEETLPSKRCTKRDSSRHSSNSSIDTLNSTSMRDNETDAHTKSKPFSTRDLLFDPVIRSLCMSAFALSFLSAGFDVLFVLYCFTPVEDGGLSLPAAQIGYCFSASAFISIVIQLLVLPRLLRVYSKVKLYRLSIAMFPAAFLLLSTFNAVARCGYDEASHTMQTATTAALWSGIAVALTLMRLGATAFSLLMILTKESSPNPSTLGSSNGLVQFACCLARAASPAFCSSMFSLSIQHNLMGGYLWVLIVSLIGLWGVNQTGIFIRAKATAAMRGLTES